MLISIIQWNSVESLLFLILMIGILIYGLAVVPLWVEVTPESIRVKQVVGTRKFLVNKIVLTQVTGEDLKGAIRVFGSGGYGGYTGWFRNKKLGRFFMLVVNKKELAMIETDKGKRFIINYPSKLFKG